MLTDPAEEGRRVRRRVNGRVLLQLPSQDLTGHSQLRPRTPRLVHPADVKSRVVLLQPADVEDRAVLVPGPDLDPPSDRHLLAVVLIELAESEPANVEVADVVWLRQRTPDGTTATRMKTQEPGELADLQGPCTDRQTQTHRHANKLNVHFFIFPPSEAAYSIVLCRLLK